MSSDLPALQLSVADAERGRRPIGISWPIGNPTGWGVYGLNLTMQLLRSDTYCPAPLATPNLGELSALQRVFLRPVLAMHARLERIFKEHPGRRFVCDFPVLTSLGEQFATDPWMHGVTGTKTVAVIFFCDPELTSEALHRARRYDAIVTGAAWNAEVLDGFGLGNVYNVLQGIDPTHFHPAERGGWFGDRFVIFSGGKLEFRKGQDLVVAAFKAFHARHADALLVTAWHNAWPHTMIGLDVPGHVVGLPLTGSPGHLEIRPWLKANGLEEGSFVDCGWIPHEQTAQVLRECDVALFPNRCEPGTNLVAMECMACGVPTILSANTGHLDLIRDDNCYSLRTQSPATRAVPGIGVTRWGESSVEEIVDVLEQVYCDRSESRRRGENGARFMLDLTWEKQVQKLLQALAPIL